MGKKESRRRLGGLVDNMTPGEPVVPTKPRRSAILVSNDKYSWPPQAKDGMTRTKGCALPPVPGGTSEPTRRLHASRPRGAVHAASLVMKGSSLSRMPV